MMEYWQQLNLREQWLAKSGLLCVVVYLFYIIVYTPLTTAVKTHVAQVSEKEATLIWMQARKSSIKNIKQLQLSTNAKLLAITTAQLNTGTFRQFPYQLQQNEIGELAITYKEVPFNQFISWFLTLCQRYTITIKEQDAKRVGTEGLVALKVLYTAS